MGRRLIGFLVGEEKLQSCEEDLPCDLSGKKSPGSTMMYSSLLSSASCNARPELEQAHLNLVKELAASLDLDDEVQVILTVLIITFCLDFLDLGERSAVEQAQLVRAAAAVAPGHLQPLPGHRQARRDLDGAHRQAGAPAGQGEVDHLIGDHLLHNSVRAADEQYLHKKCFLPLLSVTPIELCENIHNIGLKDM